MSPTPMSPMNRHAHPERTSSQDSTDGIRKRVCKACDRCRLKKSKCDGSSPCSRCKADNAICVFGYVIRSTNNIESLLTVHSERKRSQDKIYPKGYVEMLEQQQSQLVSGLKEMYHRLQKASAWEGPSLDESTGQPLTHDILSALNLLEPKHDDSGELEVFEENCDKLQSRMVSDGASFVRRRGSLSSDSDHSHHERPKTASSRNDTPTVPRLSMFKESFSIPSSSPSPLTQSPIPRSKPVTQPQYVAQSQPSIRPSPLQEPAFTNDPQLYAPEWAQALADMSYSDQSVRTKMAMQAGDFDMFTPWDAANAQMEAYQFSTYQMGNGNMYGGMPDIADLSQLDNMDFDFNTYVQQPEVMT